MTVARVTEISAASSEGFEAAIGLAIGQGTERAKQSLRNVRGAWVKDMNVFTEDGDIKAYKVNLHGELTGHLRAGGHHLEVH